MKGWMCRGIMTVGLVLAAGQALALMSDPYTVVWEAPSVDFNGSMPLGNGEIGLNVWVEAEGDLLFYISKSDAWSGIARLVKLGRIRVSLDPNPFAKGQTFRQILDVKTGAITIEAGDVALKVYVDANAPVIRVEADTTTAKHMTVAFETWRTEPRALVEPERFSAYGLMESPDPVMVEPDTIVGDEKNRVVWYHRNTTSIWEQTLRLQHMEGWLEKGKDPLLHRTFGGLIEGDGLERKNASTLASAAPAESHWVNIHILTAQTPTASNWITQLTAQAATTTSDWEAHAAWWDAFWKRSWIRVTPSQKAKAKEADAAFTVTHGYVLQRFISACAGRGSYPLKFNGSLFTVDGFYKDHQFDADFRRWGGPYWFQNTRLVYWPMLSSGDTDMMRPLFTMFKNALPFARERTRTYFGHEGVFYPETMYFWGAYAMDNYGWERGDDLEIGVTDNRYIRYHYDGILELLSLMLDYYAFTQDEAFAREELLPLAEAIPTFFYAHYPPKENGKMYFHPSQALETWQKAINPTPPIAGLKRVLHDLLRLPKGVATEEQIKTWKSIEAALPALPIKKVKGKKQILAAEEILEEARNSETPELYAIFPYRLYGVGKADLDLAQRTFDARLVKGHNGWRQDDMQAAVLGNAKQARTLLSQRMAEKHPESRFPAFWGPNMDWIPDQDHGGNALMTLQYMLLQYEGREIYLTPAWPKEWNAEFKLHAPLNTTIEGKIINGKLTNLIVTPEPRRADLKIMPVQ
jgi:alpha-L-fucosidase 2